MILDLNVSEGARLSKRAMLTFFALFLGIPFFAGAEGPELLEPEKAFRISTRVLDERNVEVHFQIRVPLSAQDAARGSVKLKVTSQGCADVGVCYMPLEQFVEVRLSGGSSPAPAAVLPPAPSRSDGLPKALRKGSAAVPQGGSR